MKTSTNTSMTVDDYSAILDRHDNLRVFSFKIYYLNIEWGKIIVNTAIDAVRYTGKHIESSVAEKLSKKCVDEANALNPIYDQECAMVKYTGSSPEGFFFFDVYIFDYTHRTTCLSGQIIATSPDENGNYSKHISGLSFPKEVEESIFKAVNSRLMFIIQNQQIQKVQKG